MACGQDPASALGANTTASGSSPAPVVLTSTVPASNVTGTGAINTANTTTATTSSSALVTVDQVVSNFKGVRSCLPFNILIAAPQVPAGADSDSLDSLTTNGRITIVADPSVINATGVAIEDGILTLSLTGEGFFSTQPIQFMVSLLPICSKHISFL